MPKRTSRKNAPRDVNVIASTIAEAVVEETEAPPKNPHAVALGSLGGKKGGRARAAKLTPEERKEIAKKAAETRWSRFRSSK